MGIRHGFCGLVVTCGWFVALMICWVCWYLTVALGCRVVAIQFGGFVGFE